jgi:hypothetical protein
MKDRITGAKPWTNSTIPAKQPQARSTPLPTTFVRPTSRGWLMALKLLYGADFSGGRLLGISRRGAVRRFEESHRTRERAMVIDPAFPGFRDEFMKVSAAGSACH